MPDKNTRDFDTLTRTFVDRRALLRRAGALGLTAGALGAFGHAAAQEASPEAAASGETIKSMTREEYDALLQEHFAFEEPQNRGGQLIISQTSDISTVNGLLTADYPTVYITGAIFEPLVNVSPIDGQIVPGLADH